MKFILALLLLPTAAISLVSCVRLLAPLAQGSSFSWNFLCGLAAYPAAHYFWHRPTRLYVLGHELSHAVAGWLSGASVHGISVKKSSGHVVLSRSNAVVALAPYCLPFYSVLCLLLFRLAAFKFDVSPYHPYFLFAMGATLAFHIVTTAEVLLGEEQPDLRQAGGVFFSLVLIVAANSLLIAALFKVLFPQAVDLKMFAIRVLMQTGLVWTWLALKMRSLAVWALRGAGNG